MAQTFGFILHVVGLGLGLAICVLDSITASEGDFWEWGGNSNGQFFAIFRPKPPYLRNGARYDQGYY